MARPPEPLLSPPSGAPSLVDQFGGPASLIEIERGKLFVREDLAAEVARAVGPFFSDCFGEREAAPRVSAASPRP